MVYVKNVTGAVDAKSGNCCDRYFENVLCSRSEYACKQRECGVCELPGIQPGGQPANSSDKNGDGGKRTDNGYTWKKGLVDPFS